MLDEEEKNANYSISWFEQYWSRKRQDYFGEISGDATVLSPEKLRQIAHQLEEDIKTFWRFRAHNTLRLMQLHSNRRKRLLHYFAFQKFKVQAMRATVQKVIESRVDASTV